MERLLEGADLETRALAPFESFVPNTETRRAKSVEP